MIRAFAAGTVITLVVTAAWSYTTVFTSAGGAPVLHLARSPWADYRQLADAPTGSGPELFAVTAAIYTLCFLIAGYRKRRKS